MGKLTQIVDMFMGVWYNPEYWVDTPKDEEKATDTPSNPLKTPYQEGDEHEDYREM